MKASHARVNPRPRGTLMPAGASAQVLAILVRAPQKFWAHGEIAAHMPEPKSLNWALRHCQWMGWVETTSDPRSARYMRYRITEYGREVFQ